VDERAATILFTTGDGLTETRGRELKRRGLFAAAVSLDHYDAAIHDQRRGHPGAFDSALKAIRVCKEVGLYTMLQIVATRDMTKPGVFDRYLDLAQQLGVHEIRLLEPMPTGCLLDHTADCFLDAQERETLRELHRRTNRVRGLPKVSSFAQIEHREMYGCGAGRQHLYIDPQGNVCPCDFTPVSFGNVGEETLDTIWKRMTGVFSRPRTTCFLMDHASDLRKAFNGTLPLPHTAVHEACSRCEQIDQDATPGFYRILGHPSKASGLVT
jgi:MoaA/NifB/PqqE/SkfB family radical SAM enzyme